MKKYITPEVEIKRFAVEDIMANSSADAVVSDQATVESLGNTDIVSYNKLYDIN